MTAPTSPGYGALFLNFRLGFTWSRAIAKGQRRAPHQKRCLSRSGAHWGGFPGDTLLAWGVYYALPCKVSSWPPIATQQL